MPDKKSPIDDIGTIENPNKKLMLTVHIGEAKDNDGNEYEMSQTVGGSPMVTSFQTDKKFILPWKDILTLAIRRGIDEPVTETNEEE